MKTLKLPLQHRLIEYTPTVRAEGDASPEAPRVTLLTDAPVERWWGIEVLDFSEGAVDLSKASRGIPLFQEHGGPWLGQPDPNLRVGKCMDLRVEGSKLTHVEVFSRTQRGLDAKVECEDDITPFRSGGYLPLKMKVTKKGDRNTGEKDTYLVTRWRPVEGSIVSFPADQKAVQPRSDETTEYEVEIEGDDTTTHSTAEEETQMKKKVRNEANGETIEVDESDPRPAITVETRSERPGSAAAPLAPGADASTDSAEIVRLCEAHGLQARAVEFLQRKLTVGQVSHEILQARTSATRPQPAAEALERAADPKGPLKKFSAGRAIRQRVAELEGRGRYDGAELEYDQEVRRGLPPNYLTRGGYFMPVDRLSPDDRYLRDMQMLQRGLGSGIPTGGAELVFDQVGEFIDILRNRAILAIAGARVSANLSGPVVFPKQTGDPTVYWMPENAPAAAPNTDLKFGTVTMSPHTMIGVVPFPRQLVNMNTNIDLRINESLGAKHALELDRVGIAGKGTDGEPLGLENNLGVATVTFGGAITYPKVVDMGGKVADANADTNTMRYITTPLVASKAKQTLAFSAAGSAPIWNGTFRDGEMAGYSSHATKQVPITLGSGSDHGLYHGDFSNIEVGMWGAMEFILDIITQAAKGQIVITTFQMADIVNLRPEAFCKALTLTP